MPEKWMLFGVCLLFETVVDGYAPTLSRKEKREKKEQEGAW